MKKEKAPTALRILVISIFSLVLISAVYTFYTIRESLKAKNNLYSITTTFQTRTNKLIINKDNYNDKENNYLDFDIVANQNKEEKLLKYNIVLIVNENNTLSEDKIHILLTNQNKDYLLGFTNDTVVSDFKDNDYVIFKGVIKSNTKEKTTQKLRIKIWLDDSNLEINYDSLFKLEVKVEGESI